MEKAVKRQLTPKGLLSSILGSLAIFALAFSNFSAENVFFLNDQALSSAVGMLNAGGEPSLLGPPAALGGRHPGPYYYYWEACINFLAGGNIYSAFWIGCFLKTGLLVALVFLFVRLVKDEYCSSVLFTFLVLSVLAGMWWWLLRVMWHSNMLFLIFGADILALLSFAKRARSFGLVLIFSSLLAATHFAAWPAAAGIVFTAILVDPHNSWTNTRSLLRNRWLTLQACLAAGLWLPTLSYAYRYGESVLPFSGKSAHHARAGVAEAFVLLGRFWQVFTFGDSLDGKLPPFSVLSISLLTFSFGAYLAYRRRGTLRTLALLILVEALLYLPILASLRPGLKLHYLQSLALLPTFAAGLLFSELFERIKVARVPAGFLAFAVVLSILFLGAATNLSRLQRPLFSPFETLAHAEQVASIIKTECERSPCEDIRIRVRGESRSRENAYYLFLGEKYFFHMKDSRKLKEHPLLSPVERPEKAGVVFEVTCGKDSAEGNVDLSSCRSCGTCSLRRESIAQE